MTRERLVVEGIKSYYREHQTYPTLSALTRKLQSQGKDITKQGVDYIVRSRLIPMGIIDKTESKEKKEKFFKVKYTANFKRLKLLKW